MDRLNLNCIGNQLLLFSLLVFLLIGISSAADSGVTITDALGRTVNLEKPAERIGFTGYMIGEPLVLAGAWDKVVARDGYISDPVIYSNLDSIPSISSPNVPYELNFEKIMEIKPDVMIMPVDKWDTSEDTIQQMIDSLEPEIPVVFLNLNDPDTFEENFEKLGIITGTGDKVNEYLDFFDRVIGSIREKTSSLPDSEKPKIFLKAAGYTPDQLATWGGKETMTNQLWDIVGANSISKTLPTSWTEVDPEWLIGQDMDDIIVQCWNVYYPETFGYQATDPSHKLENGKKIIDEISAMDVFSSSEAVTNGKVYLIHDPLVSTARFVVGAAYLAKWLHSDLFFDLDPVQIHQEYLTRYIGADYDLSTGGLDAYP
ncbi:iron ABC transporter substrate-binding protein [Methanospirillum stamsii]|uniref:Iron ABC transporter substrate-binding protein n=1 Tax=Methanospirillum stamsii TaxID=1277351 RepID=A0A2V2NGU9_9EURY|nr:iron ABC transporter substrate-binding protein [Methanospirillum stamsii]